MSGLAALRAVFDCQVFFQAAVRRGPSFRCLEDAETPELTLLLSSSIIAEVKDVLSRPVLRQKFKTLTDETISEFLDRVRKFSELSPEPPNAFSLPRDPDDEMYLDLPLRGVRTISSVGTSATSPPAAFRATARV